MPLLGFSLFGSKQPTKEDKVQLTAEETAQSSESPLKLSEVHVYLSQFLQRAAQAVIKIRALNRAEPANDASIIIDKLLIKTQALLDAIGRSLEKVQAPAWYSVIPAAYGQSLIEAAYEILGLCHHFIFEIYGDLYQQGLLAPDEICKINEIDTSLTALEESCNGLLKLGLQGKMPFNFEADALRLQKLIAAHKPAYQPSTRAQLTVSPVYLRFNQEFLLLFNEIKQKFANLEIDYVALSQFDSIVKETFKIAFDQIDAVLNALPDFKVTPSPLTESEGYRWHAFSWTRHERAGFRRSIQHAFQGASSSSFKRTGRASDPEMSLVLEAGSDIPSKKHDKDSKPLIKMS